MTISFDSQHRSFLHPSPVVEDEILQELTGLHAISPKAADILNNCLDLREPLILSSACCNFADQDMGIASSELFQ
jgi:hypothetical protein